MNANLRVSQEVQLKNMVFNLGAKMGAYVWMTTTHLPAPCIGLIQFEAKSFNDIHIAFNKDIRKRSVGQDGREEGAPIYEIVIGGTFSPSEKIKPYRMDEFKDCHSKVRNATSLCK